MPDLDANNFKVDHPEQFPLATAIEHKAVPRSECDRRRAARYRARCTGDLAGRGTSCGDQGQAGRCGEERPVAAQVQSNDVSGAYQTYLKAENDERLARLQLERAQLLYDKGAIAKSALEAG